MLIRTPNYSPALNPEERASLAADIKANGLHEKIVYRITAEGQPEIIDGISRADALIDASCSMASSHAPTSSRSSSPPRRRSTAYIVSANIHRRHLSKGQRTELIKKLVLTGMKPKAVAAAVKTSVDTVEKATKAERATVKAAKREAAKQALAAGPSARRGSRRRSKSSSRTMDKNPKLRKMGHLPSSIRRPRPPMSGSARLRQSSANRRTGRAAGRAVQGRRASDPVQGAAAPRRLRRLLREGVPENPAGGDLTEAEVRLAARRDHLMAAAGCRSQRP